MMHDTVDRDQELPARTDATMVAEDKTKLDTADVVLTYSQTKQEHVVQSALQSKAYWDAVRAGNDEAEE